jgi:hypothetical protein
VESGKPLYEFVALICKAGISISKAGINIGMLYCVIQAMIDDHPSWMSKPRYWGLSTKDKQLMKALNKTVQKLVYFEGASKGGRLVFITNTFQSLMCQVVGNR